MGSAFTGKVVWQFGGILLWCTIRAVLRDTGRQTCDLSPVRSYVTRGLQTCCSELHKWCHTAPEGTMLSHRQAAMTIFSFLYQPAGQPAASHGRRNAAAAAQKTPVFVAQVPENCTPCKGGAPFQFLNGCLGRGRSCRCQGSLPERVAHLAVREWVMLWAANARKSSPPTMATVRCEIRSASSWPAVA